MNELFLKIVNMSISASWLVLAVLVLRLALKKAPKWVNVLLWGIVAVRLIVPFSVESAFSLIPSAHTIPKEMLSGSGFAIQTGITLVDDRVNSYLGDRYFEGVTVPAFNGLTAITFLSIVWLAGLLLLAAYTAVSYWRLRRRVNTAVRLRENIYQSESVSSPFVLGIIKPKIYLPFKLDAQNLEYVVAHEMAHIRRKDHWWKPFGFLLLTIHWFNPLMWIAYVLLCRDIELACDERVIRQLDNEGRADYTQALVTCSVNRRMIAACPLAFGEVGVKERVKSVMNYKKPGLWAGILAVMVCAITAVCFLTDPVSAAEEPDPNDYILEIQPENIANPGMDTSEQDKANRLAQLGEERIKLAQEMAEMEEERKNQEIKEAIMVLFESIQSSPAGSFDPYRHIAAHLTEFDRLVNYGTYTLHFCFSELMGGNLPAVRSRLMAVVCHRIAIRWNDELLALASSDSSNAQWFDAFQEKALRLSGEYSAEKFQEMYPASWIFIQMTSE